MQADERHIETMLAMQQVDLERLQAEKKLADLPQRTKILKVRQKKASIAEKNESVQEMLSAARAKVQRISDEDERLAQKAAEVQKIIDSARGDYRSVESRTKELEGISKRRATLAVDLDRDAEELARAEAVAQQISSALAQLEETEQALVASFRKDGSACQAQIAQLTARHDALEQTLPADLAALYEKAAKRCGGVAIGTLREDGSCSVCRSTIDDAHLLSLHAQRPLGYCPRCNRLLIVGA